MRQGLQDPGYTVVEVLIVLAVTSALMISAMLLIGGQQQKTGFQQSIHDIQQQIDDIVNNVATGYYLNTGNVGCSADDTNPPHPDTAGAQGTNKGCVFVGRAIQFGVAGTDGSGFNVYNLVGRRQLNGRDVTNLTDAAPKAMAKAINDSTYDSWGSAVDSRTLAYGLQTQSVTCTGRDDGTGNSVCSACIFGGGQNIGPAGVLAFISDFDASLSSTRSIGLYSVLCSNLNQDPTQEAAFMNIPIFYRPLDKAEICFAGGDNQSALLTIGGNNRGLATTLDIKSTSDCS